MTDPQDLTTRRKRALYRANHRGTQEMDILIGGYVADHLDTLDPAMLDRLEVLMNHEETDLQAWLLGQRDIPENADRDLIDKIRNHKITRTETL
ncbi:succinate dehydrogenase assembly factor 2 [Pelagibacterium mangrovi]|uniref:succinate dehydrogenase assembly factor 2 n=1 Tax=Pelagibacterium mangrovi TaxID=3119828 RepID=UPI002FC8FE6C